MENNNLIKNVVQRLLLRYPLFGNVIANLDFRFTEELVPAPAFTDGRCVFYRQQFLDNYSDAEREFIIAHELFHIVLKHLFRNEGRDEDLLNYVEDAIINQLLVQHGLTMPKGAINIPDALNYSVEELYMKYLPNLKQIKEWMNANTYHIEIAQLEEWLNEMYSKDLQELMDENAELRSEILRDLQKELEERAQAVDLALRMEFPSVKVGKTVPLLSWKELLRSTLVAPDQMTVAFYEVEMDGIIRKEGKPDTADSESEIIIDSSASMSMAKIKAILRECKNILSTSRIKVGFHDVAFYGWNEIKDESDIDNLQIIGRGGTNFFSMADSFSDQVDNKIVITDGLAGFPKDRPDILWVVLNHCLPGELSECPTRKDINYIFIDEKDVSIPKTLGKK